MGNQAHGASGGKRAQAGAPTRGEEAGEAARGQSKFQVKSLAIRPSALKRTPRRLRQQKNDHLRTATALSGGPARVLAVEGDKNTHRSMPLPSDSPATAAALRSMSSTTLESLAESP